MYFLFYFNIFVSFPG